jgi:GT2 family glycosyltransferase
VERNSVQERGFASKALAFMEGYKMVSELSYSYIGNLDADVSFNASYYRILIEKMENNKRLGVASGVILEKSFKGYQRVTSSLNHAVGAVQFWKRECFEQVGGYRPVTVSGIDAISELIARMKGWETRSFQDLHVYHHRPVDTSNTKSALERAYRAGLTEYHIGTSSCFALFKAIRRWRERPIILSAFIRLLAYWAAWVKKIPRDAPDELIEYLKREQKYRLKAALKGQFDWR